LSDYVDSDVKFSIIPEWILVSPLSHKAVRVYAVLARYADSKTLQAWPSRATIAGQSGCSIRTVDAAIDELVGYGAVEKERRVENNHYTSSMYVIRRAPRGSAKIALGSAKNDTRVVQKTAHRTITNELEPTNYINADIKAFDTFWESYPKKADKRAAQKAFVKAVKRAEAETIIDGAQRYADDPNRKPEFTKYPATWLNADAWANEPMAAPTPVNEWGKPLRPPAEVPDARAWVKSMHELGEHWECRKGEFGCK
jgi:hypothetical protein